MDLRQSSNQNQYKVTQIRVSGEGYGKNKQISMKQEAWEHWTPAGEKPKPGAVRCKSYLLSPAPHPAKGLWGLWWGEQLAGVEEGRKTLGWGFPLLNKPLITHKQKQKMLSLPRGKCTLGNAVFWLRIKRDEYLFPLMEARTLSYI